MNKLVEPRPYANPEAAARKLLEIANAHEPYMDGRILIERLNGAMLYQHKATQPNTRPGSYAPSSAAGWCCTKAAPSCRCRRRPRICSPDKEPRARTSVFCVARRPPPEGCLGKSVPGRAARGLGPFVRASHHEMHAMCGSTLGL
jgi:hypothetical protein